MIAHATPGVRVADWLSLAAAPAFAAMALLTVVFRDDMPIICSTDAFPLSGMVPMYVLMSLFHSAPWLKLLARKQT
ncbi:MAG TPA: hypothetical protein VIM56_13720 [Rhizomicrobium sp.]